MCGICGVIQRNPLGDREIAAVRAMQAALVHRGPDGAGEFRSAHVYLAMRRLSIIDLQGSAQPLWNEDRSIALVVNGEIYNYKELREELHRRGHFLRTQGDGEPIVHLYEERGPEALQALRGMFALALWDAKAQRLFLARDRMGEKPLYLYVDSDRILFASELRALLRSGEVPKKLDPVALDRFFHLQYVPEPQSPIRGVVKLDAAQWWTVDLASWQIERRYYWDLRDVPPVEGNPVRILRSELEAVSDIVVRSDVPVGVALSGGLDSAVVAAFTVRRYPGKLQAFSVGYPGRPACDEREAAARTARHLDLPFHDIELSAEDMRRSFPEVVARRDDPIADISGYGYWAVAHAARERGVPVLLQGQGGDELFWGYDWLRAAYRETLQKQRAHRWGWLALPTYLRPRLPEGLAPWQVRLWIQNAAGLSSGWRRFRWHRSLPPDRPIFLDRHVDTQEALRRCPALYPRAFRDALRDTPHWHVWRLEEATVPLDIALTALVIRTYLRENGIAQGDRLSMASSVEMRLPLVDYRFVERVIGLRKSRSDANLPPKQWLRELARDVLPEDVLRRPKRGFQPPVQEWYRALVSDYAWILPDGYLVHHGVLRPEAARDLAQEPIPAKTVTPLVFKALVLEMWCRQVLAGDTVRARPNTPA